jgi:RNase P subunit RPR2
MYDLQEESEGGNSAVRSHMRKNVLRSKMKGKVGRPKKRRFICEYCGKSFLHSGHFEHHIRTRHEQSQFACLTCNETYVTKEELMLHQNEVKHTGEGISEVQSMDENDRDLDESQVRFCNNFVFNDKIVYL